MMLRIATVLLVLVPSVATADRSLQRGGKWNCNKDPVVYINNGGGSYSFKGACERISINGGGNTLKIESVDVLDVSGSENTIKVGTVGTIDVGGAENTITWRKAKDGDAPALRGQPDKNTIVQAD